MTEAISARSLWRGPKVLKGRRITAGRSKDRAKASTIMSAPIFEAE
jgi:hypothetical protein